MTIITPLACLSDEQLLTETRRLADDERRATVALVAALVEVDTRRLYLRESCSSLFTYCTQILHLSEHAAYGRIEAARVARRFPVILEQLATGSLTMTAICLLKPHLTPDNHLTVLAAAVHKSKRDVELLVATLRPQPPIASSIRKLPAPAPAKTEASQTRSSPDTLLSELQVMSGSDNQFEEEVQRPLPARRPKISPLNPEQYKVQFTISAATHQKLRRAQDLMRHSLPNGDPAVIFDRALSLLVAELEKAKRAATQHPRARRPAARGSRHIPADVRREIWERDGGQCAFVGTNGRCVERGFLEFHHVVPYADGGESVATNLELRCHAHNAYEAERWFGPLLVREGRVRYWWPVTRSG